MVIVGWDSPTLGWIRRRWSSLGGFIVVGLDLPPLVVGRWVGFVGIGRHWGGFAGIGRRWVGFAWVGLAHVVLPALVLRRWVGFVAVGLRWQDSSLSGWNRWRWSSLGWIRLLWSSSHPGFQCLCRLVSPSFAASYLPPSPHRIPLLTRLVSSSSAPSFPPPSRPHPFGKGRGSWGCILACEGAKAVLQEPTSLNRGEGLVARSTCEVGGIEGKGKGEGGGGGGRKE